MSVGCFIIARLNSSRLPEKNILDINGKPMIINLINRISESKYIDEIIICTSKEKTDDALERVAKEYKVKIFRGSLENIMDRIINCANYYGINDIVEILGDNPLIDNHLLDFVLEEYVNNQLDYCTNISLDYKKELLQAEYKCFPIGLRVQVYKTIIAKEYVNYTDANFISEHPTNFIFENSKKFKTKFLQTDKKWDFL
ncbi:hypothetical protein OAU87_05885, partial [Alphaproteobacteria bacterium]|nr:hypothetical protein [Alphaproteobacteria bacterium]